MDSIKELTDKAAKLADEGIVTATTLARSAADTAVATYNTAQEQADVYFQEAQTQVAKGQEVARQYEELAFSYLQQGLDYAAENPTTTYAVVGGTLALGLPFTRRILYRSTFGRFRSDEGTLRTAEERLGKVTTSAEEFGQEVGRLESQMVVAEQEMKSSIAKLKTTRREMQRLMSSVIRNEKVAKDVLEDLRSLRGPENILQLRAEAASQKAVLKQQKKLLDKYINRIVGQDI